MNSLYGMTSGYAQWKRDVELVGPPPGTQPNFINPPSRGPEMVSVSIAMTTLACAVVLARVYIKTFVTKAFDWSDYFAIGALLTSIARTVINCVAVYKFGLGRHLWDVNPKYFASLRNSEYIMDMVYLAGVMWVKFSILLLYARVFHVRERFRKFCYFMMFITFAYCTSFFFIYAFDCKPVYYTWHLDLNHYNCIEITTIKVATGAVNILTDLIIMVMPIPLVLQLQLQKAQKLGLLLLFSTGILILITTIVREIFVVRTLKEYDQTWVVTDEVIWLTVELNIGLICVSLIILAPIWRKILSSNMGLTYVRSLISLLRNRSSSKLSDTDRSFYAGQRAGHLSNDNKDAWTVTDHAQSSPSVRSDRVNLMEIRVQRDITQSQSRDEFDHRL